MISINPAKGDLWAKNKKDQRILSSSCAPKMVKAILTDGWFRPFRQTRNNDTPIRINKAVQTGPNSQFGGLKLGFFSDAYQVGIWGLVKIEPMNPAKRLIKILNANFK